MAKASLDDDLSAAVDKATGMADLKRTAKEIKKETAPVEASNTSEGPSYPWGLEIHLETESLKKLGIKTLPAVGKKLRIEAIAVVESVREEERVRNGKKSEPQRDLTLQIQKMAINPAKKS